MNINIAWKGKNHLLPFVYAITGSDMTSRLYVIRKNALKRLRENVIFRELALVFLNSFVQSN